LHPPAPECALHDRNAAVEIDVAPLQGGGFAAPHAGTREGEDEEIPTRRDRVADVEKPPELVAGEKSRRAPGRCVPTARALEDA
jgi:hypothetical protein